MTPYDSPTGEKPFDAENDLKPPPEDSSWRDDFIWFLQTCGELFLYRPYQFLINQIDIGKKKPSPSDYAPPKADQGFEP